ncbi:MAG TPA: PAS domain S-box protein [Prolixibacteraceae bacterium]|nr:PAS domain S-box protein [Prolixibacteraceae bacterium]
MFIKNEKPEYYSGYIRINETLEIEEISGHIKEILRVGNIDENDSFLHLIEVLSKNMRSYFKEEIIPAITARRIRHFFYERKNTTVSISVTPIASGFILLSFEEMPAQEKFEQQSLPEKLKEIFIRINPDLQVSEISRNCYPKLGEIASEIKGKSIEEIELFGNKTTQVTDLINKAFQQQKKIEEELQLKKGEKPIWWNMTFIPETDPVSKQQSVLVILKNINRYKKAEARLLENEQRFQLAAEAADLGIWDHVIGSGKTFYSRKWKLILGYYPDELEDEFSVWEDLLHPEDKERMSRFVNDFVKSDLMVYNAEFRMKHKNGNYVWIKSRASAIRDKSGKAIRIIGTHRDITEEKKSESEYTKLHQAILQSPISVIITNTEGVIEFFNPAFCKVTGWSDHELIGKKTNILKSGFQPDSFYEKLWKTISAGNEWQGEFKNRKKTGEFFWELASISPIRNNFGTITHYVKIAENITYLKKIERDLKKAKQDAEIANNYKNHFLANMSHEIRTPINTIIGFSELMKNETLSTQKRNKYSDIIEENSQALLRLIDDIIDVSKIEANELKIKKEACALGELFSELEMTYNNILKRKQNRNLKLIFQLREEAHHDVIFTDPYRLKQILNNLYINALKYTETGHIEIGYNIINDNKLRFFVSDTGIGIPNDRIKNIFKRFNYTDEATNTGVASGLGLSICKDLALLLGGDINVKSIEGEGSVFFLTLPYDKIKIPMVRSAVQAPTAPQQGKYDFSKFTIMVAEDTPYNYEYLKSILQKTGANIIWAKDGIDVLTIFNTTKIDLILMDIQLPEISGYEATTQIRLKDLNIPIIAQTAYAMAEDKQRCYDSGCNEVLVKPIRMDDVLTTVAKYLHK